MSLSYPSSSSCSQPVDANVVEILTTSGERSSSLTASSSGFPSTYHRAPSEFMPIHNGRSDRPIAQYSSLDLAQDEDGEQRAESGALNGRASPTAMFNPYFTGRVRASGNGSKNTPIDRQEIIKRIKSRDSRPTSPELARSPTPTSQSGLSSSQRPQTPDKVEDAQTYGLEIERPRSALHRGDFWERKDADSAFSQFGDATRDDELSALSTSPVVPWHPDCPAAVLRQVRQVPSIPPGLSTQRPARSRAVSQASLSSSFVYKLPTSPLVQFSRPDTPEPGRQRSRSPDKSRRHTFSPQSFGHAQSALEHSSLNRQARQPPPLRAERSFPYQAHQPRRSMHSFGSLPQSSSASARRPSFPDSPLHHAPMVGSYEESILRGRMSTTPSRPLNFVAQIGVLGRGDCRANLRCPPHATVPFPAVFYSYSGTKATPSDQPSPYVGLVDLENSLPNTDTATEHRRQRVQATLNEGDSRASSRTRDDESVSDVQTRRRRKQKQKRRSGSPRAPPGGSYRIPQQGQLQIIIKNPNKTAVKLFLIPYDLSDMQPGQKTFIRQRSYSAGPIIDMPLSSRKNLGTDRPEAALSASEDPNERPMLRYLVHLHLCCPSKGRYFLYKSVRLVFANRVPDGKEKLRNEVQLPEPRYTTYKPAHDSHPHSTPLRDSARRRSNIEAIMPSPPHKAWTPTHPFLAHSLPSTELTQPFDPLPPPPLPSQIHHRPTQLVTRPSSRQTSDTMMDIDSDAPSQETRSNRSAFSSPTTTDGRTSAELFSQVAGMRRLDDPFDFERDRSRERRGSVRSESLLSRRLRDLALPPPG